MQTAEPSPQAASAPSQDRLRVAAGIAAILALSAGLRFPWLTAEPLWYDEVFSIVATGFLPDPVQLALADQTNPPGFYVLLGAWIRLGGIGDAWLRTLPAVAGALVPLALLHAARALRIAWGPALVAGALAAASPLLVSKSLELRAYAPLALLGTLALAQVATIADDRASPRVRSYLALGTLFAALVMLHYFGALSVAALVAGSVFLCRDRRRAWRILLAAIPAALLAIGWLGLVVRRAATLEFSSNTSWIDTSALASFGSFGAQAVGNFGSPALQSMVVAVLLTALGWSAFAIRDGRVGALACAALLPPALALAFGAVLDRPLWVPRYFIATIPPLLLLLALAAASLRAPWRSGAYAVVVGWSLLAGVHGIVDHARKPDWALLLRELSHGDRIAICGNEAYVTLSLAFHARREGMPVDVLPFSDCQPTAARTWVVYRPETARSLDLLRDRGATFGPRVSLLTESPLTDARAIRWNAR